MTPFVVKKDGSVPFVVALQDANRLAPLVAAAMDAAHRADAAADEAEQFLADLSIERTEVVGRPAGVALVDGNATNRAQAFFLDPVENFGLLSSVDIFDRVAGTMEVAVYRDVAGTLTRVGLSSITSQGGNVERRCALATPLPVQPGDIRAIRSNTAGLYSVTPGTPADGQGYALGPEVALPETVTLSGPITNLRLQLRLNVDYREQVVTAEAFAVVAADAIAAGDAAAAAAVAAADAGDTADDLVDKLTTEVIASIGRPVAAALLDGLPIQPGQAYFLDAVQGDGVFQSVDVFDKAAGTAQVAAFRNIGGTLTRIGLSTIATLGGDVQRRCPVAAPFEVQAGDILCLRATADGLYTLTQNAADGAAYFFGPALDIPETVQFGGTSANVRLEVRLNIASRVVAVTADAFTALKEQVGDVEAGVVALRGSPRRMLAADVRPALPSADTWIGLITYGQSQSTGYQARPALTLAQPYANRTFSGGVGSGRAGNTYGAVNTAPGMSGSKLLVEGDTTDAAPGSDGSPVNGETICTTAASTFVELAAAQNGIDPASTIVFASAAGHAGYSIAQLSDGSPWYGSLIDHITRAAELAAAAGKAYAPPVIYFVQGADDARDGQSTAYWRAAFLKLVDDVNSDGLAAINAAMATAGLPEQSAPIHFLLAQTASPYFGEPLEDLAKIRQAQFECVNASPLVHFAFPEASLPAKVGDFLHYTATSQIRAGRHGGRMMKQLIVDGCEPDCVWPLSAIATGTTVRIKFRVPAFPLVLDEATFGTLTDKGFKVTDAGGVVPIVGVAVSARGDEVEIALGRALGASPVVRHGLDYIGSTNNHFASANGCLRDSTPATTAVAGATYPLWHVAPSFVLPVYVVAPGIALPAEATEPVAPPVLTDALYAAIVQRLTDDGYIGDGIPANALTSPVDNRMLTSPLNGRILTRAT